MRTTISARHIELDSRLRKRAQVLLNRLGSMGNRALAGAAVFDTVGGEAWVELRLHCAGGNILVATAEASDHRSALDKVASKIRRQMKKLQSRPRAMRHATSAP